MANSRVGLDTRAVFWRTVGVVFCCLELVLWSKLPRQIRRARRVLFTISRAPYAFVAALVVGAFLTLMLDVLVRLIVRPLILRWHAPPSDESVGYFHLAANERIIDSTPARRASGRRWPPGTLARTNLRVWFFPLAHDIDVWSCPLADLVDVRLEPVPHVALGIIRGWPDRLTVRVRKEGTPEVFAVPEPADVLSWFQPPRSTAVASATLF